MKKLFTLLLTFILIINITGCNKSYERYQADFTGAFDTYTQIIGYAQNKKEFDGYAQFIYDELNRYHQLFTIYDSYDGMSNIKTINENAGIAPVKVDKEIIDMIEYSINAYNLTDGKVNIAMGSVLKIWHDYREQGINDPSKAQAPPMALLKEAQKHTDISDIVIDKENSTVYLKDAKMSLDVGAIAKGYTVELVANKVKEKGFISGIINVGGNIKAIGKPMQDDLNTWNIGLQDPNNETGIIDSVYINDISLVTSGDYQRYYMVGDKKYAHIIDPETLMPANNLKAVTIIAKDSALADVLSTALFILPYEDGLKLISSIGNADAYWIFTNGEIKTTEGIKELLKSNGAGK